MASKEWVKMPRLWGIKVSYKIWKITKFIECLYSDLDFRLGKSQLRILASIFGFFALKNMIFYICLLLDKKWVKHSELLKMHIFHQEKRADDF